MKTPIPFARIAAAAALSVFAMAASAQTTLRFGHANNAGEVAFDLYQEFADNVTKKSGGQLTIRVFPSEQLGKEVDLLQQLKSGALDISSPSMPTLNTMVPAFEMPSAPFLWKDWKEAEAAIRGPAMNPIWVELADKHNIVPLTKIWYWGWRNFTFTTKEVRKPEDMAGLKVRVPESPIWVEMVRGFGAAPTPIPFGEVYTALQQKTVDGQENPIPTIFSRKFYEVQGVLTMSRHMLQNNTILINKASLAKLKPELQKLLIDEAEAASAKNTQLQQAREVSMLEDIRKSGKTKIIEDADRDAFAAKMAAVYPKLEARWGTEHWKRMQAEIARMRGTK
jgi:tripartite ATP-independent transporter DctP family solute receptor